MIVVEQPPSDLAWEIIRLPRCGLCVHYPIDAGMKHYCSIYDGVRHRLSLPPRTGGKRNAFICFTPMPNQTWEQYKKIRRDREASYDKKEGEGKKILNPENGSAY